MIIADAAFGAGHERLFGGNRPKPGDPNPVAVLRVGPRKIDGGTKQ